MSNSRKKPESGYVDIFLIFLVILTEEGLNRMLRWFLPLQTYRKYQKKACEKSVLFYRLENKKKIDFKAFLVILKACRELKRTIYKQLDHTWSTWSYQINPMGFS